MKVKLTTGRAGADFSQAPGTVVDLDAAEAKQLIDRGQATLAKPRAKAAKETAAKAPAKRNAMQNPAEPRDGVQPDTDGSADA